MKVDRLVSIIMILLDKKRISAQELADRFEVSPRTIYRDVESINRAGIPVRSIPGVGGGFEVMPQYKVDKKVFSTADLSAILMGLSGLSGVMRGDDLANALAKVKSFIPAEAASDIELKANQVHIDLNQWMGNKDIPLNLEAIKTALQENKLLSFEYTDPRGSRTLRTVEPYQLILKSSHWYFQGYCHKRNDFRLFRLSRILNLQILGESFISRECQLPQLDFDDVLAAMQTEIKLRIHKSVADKVLDYCAQEHFSSEDDEHYIVRFPFVENDYHYNILLGFGNGCECLEPASVRTEMKRRIHALAALYES